MKLLNLGHLFLFQCFMQHVFVYGSLLFPEIVEGLTGHKFETLDATLQNYVRRTVKNCDYPAIIPGKDGQVLGKILLNVDKRSLEVLRFFEGNEYACVDTIVKVNNGEITACVFVWIEDTGALEKGDWSAEIFERRSLNDYVRNVVPETVNDFERLSS